MSAISFRDALKVWIRIACLSFGGPAGQIAVMHRLLVDEKKWISENRFLHALNYCMLLPGPEAQQLITYIGWLMFGIRGGLTAGLLFVLPGFLSILALSLGYVVFNRTSWMTGLLFGVKAAVIVVVAEAVLRISKRALKNKEMVGLAITSFVALFIFRIPFPVVILSAGFLGLFGGRIWPNSFWVIRGHADSEKYGPAIFNHEPPLPTSFLFHFFKTAGLWIFIWFSPVLALYFLFGTNHILFQQALFFSKAAMVTFGGAYSVLSYIAQEAVQSFGWLNAGEMLDGLGMAETTPGPLIQVVQFVGFLGAYRSPEPFSPIWAAIIASLVITWVTYAPCFLWIFLGAPYIEKLRGKKSLNCILSAITAAVVGVIANLAGWFALHVLFGKVNDASFAGLKLWIPDLSTFSLTAAILTVGSGIMLLRFKMNLFAVLAICALAGIILKLIY